MYPYTLPSPLFLLIEIAAFAALFAFAALSPANRRPIRLLLCAFGISFLFTTILPAMLGALQQPDAKENITVFVGVGLPIVIAAAAFIVSMRFNMTTRAATVISLVAGLLATLPMNLVMFVICKTMGDDCL